MVADGSAYGGSKEMSLLYTNVAADLSAVFAKKIVKTGFCAPFWGILRPLSRAKSIFLLFLPFLTEGAISLDAA